MSCTAHAPCSECRALLARGATYETLALHRGESLSEVERSRLWAKIDGERSVPRGFDLRWLFAISAAAAAGVALALLVKASDPPQTAEWVAVQPGQEINVAGAELKIERAGTMWIEPGEVTRELRVFRGVLTIDEKLAEARPLSVETQQATILAIGAAYRLEVEEGRTELRVDRGEVEILSGEKKQIVRAGESIVVQHNPVEQDIATARALIGRDDQRAGDLADSVLARKPSGEAEVEALIIAADARRRSGDLRVAESRYAQVIAHPAGTNFAEEATLRRAAVLAELGRDRDALHLLQTTAKNFAPGSLRPERVALEARLLHEAGDLTAAATALEAMNDHTDRVLDPVRLDVAKKLRPRDPARAEALLKSVRLKNSSQ